MKENNLKNIKINQDKTNIINLKNISPLLKTQLSLVANFRIFLIAIQASLIHKILIEEMTQTQRVYMIS